MPGVDGRFDAGEGVCLLGREFSAEDLRRAGEELLSGGGEEVSEGYEVVGDSVG